jgi:hypothetical protein
MKIALIGNMNNNNFAMMRYFRDLGADAHLLLYSNDGKGTLSHFTPEADTWEIERWSSFIHQTDIPNALIAALDFPISTLIGLWSKMRRIAGYQDSPGCAVTRAQIRRAYYGYDRLIGSGSTPAALSRIDRELDVFYPYSLGVEFLGAHHFRSSLRGPLYRRYLYNAVRRQQLRGISHARCVVSTDRDVTGIVLEGNGIKNIHQTIPMVYNGETIPAIPPTSLLNNVESALPGVGISILHHARLMWKRSEALSDEEHLISTKNSDWLIYALAKFVAARPNLRPHLFIVEYGPDVEPTKELVLQLGIQKFVTWLPKMARRELMWLLRRVSVGVGEFMNPPCMIWGGTGWESLASGKPLLQAFRFEEGEFERIYGYPPPPMLPVRTEEDLLKRLLFVADHTEQAAAIGERAREWFNTYNGIALAKKWLDLVTDPAASHQTTISSAH